MGAENIERIGDVMAAKPLNDTRIKASKKVPATAKQCLYFKDIECRAPLCDMEMCQKCPEGHGFCSRTILLRQLVSRVLMFIVCFLVFADFM